MTKEPKWLNPTVWKHSRISRCFSALTGFPWKFIVEVCRFRPSNNTGWETKSVERANPFAPTLRKDLQSKGSSAAEFKRYLRMAIGSSDEMRVWARYCLDLDYIDEAVWQHWRNEYQEISKMLHGLSSKWRKR